MSRAQVRLTLIVLISTTFASAAVAGLERETGVQVVGVLKQDRDCSRELQNAAEKTLDQLGARGGTARLVYAHQLRLALEKARVSKVRSREVVETLTRVADELGYSIPEFSWTVRFVQELVEHLKLGFCALPKDCSLGTQPVSHLAFTTCGGPALLLAPVPGDEGMLRWALNYYSTLALGAGENYVAHWLQAAHRLENLRAGDGGRFLRAFFAELRRLLPATRGLTRLRFCASGDAHVHDASENAQLFALCPRGYSERRSGSSWRLRPFDGDA